MPLQKLSHDRGGAAFPRALEGRNEVIRLFDAYADLLTARQRALVRMYYHDDLSLGEIGVRLGVSRQAVFDSLRRSIAEMRHLEERLGVLAGRTRAARGREEAVARLEMVEHEVARLAAASRAGLGPLWRALRALRACL
jgi:uncharacterized protein